MRDSGDCVALCLRVMMTCILLTGLAACGSRAKAPVPYEKASVDNIKTIALLAPAVPSKANAILANSVGKHFGLIGMLVDNSMKDSRDDELTQLLVTQNFDARKLLTDALTKSLEQRGYKVVQVAIARENMNELLKSYVGVSETTDAYLDVSMAYGYVAANAVGDAPYRPFARTSTRLVRASDKSVLMEDKVYYNALGAPRNAVTIPADEAYSFSAFSNIEAEPAKAAEGINVAVTAAADTIAKLLK